MAVAIMQPYFFPYLGYFQLVQSVDHFVFYDDVMFIKKGWINRNRILMQRTDFMVTIPLEKQSQHKSIRESTIAWHTDFAPKCITQLEAAYKKAPQFIPVMDLIRRVLDAKPLSLADLAARSVMLTWEYLGLQKQFYQSTELGIAQDVGRAQRLIDITKSLGAHEYRNALNGQALYAKPAFAAQGIDLTFVEAALPVYKQDGVDTFIPGLSIIDVLMWNSKADVVDMVQQYTLK